MTINVPALVGHFTGSLFTSYLILRFCMYVCKNLRKKPNGMTQIVIMGVIVLGIVIMIAGFGLQDGGPKPLFDLAFYQYLGPVVIATTIELVRHKKTIEQGNNLGNSVEK